MISLPERRLILHPTRTGGQSVEVATIYKHLGKKGRNKEHHKLFFVYDDDSCQHYPLDKLLKIFRFAENWEKVCTVRHPYDRVKSEFKYQRRGYRRSEFDSAPWLAGDINHVVKSGHIWSAAYPWHGMPMHAYFDDDTKIIRLENFEKDWSEVLPDLAMQHENPIPGHSDIDDLDGDSKSLIHDRFAEDFEILGYEK